MKSARTVGHISLLINDQTIPRISGKMPHAEGSMRIWRMHLKDLRSKLWKDALNVTAASCNLFQDLEPDAKKALLTVGCAPSA